MLLWNYIWFFQNCFFAIVDLVKEPDKNDLSNLTNFFFPHNKAFLFFGDPPKISLGEKILDWNIIFEFLGIHQSPSVLLALLIVSDDHIYDRTFVGETKLEENRIFTTYAASK